MMFFKEMIIFLFVVAIVMAILTGLSYVACEQRWSDSSIPHRWVFFGGCQVQIGNNWIPEKNYREAE